MATKLSLYNGALRVLKERGLASLAERQESCRLLDAVWDDSPTGDGAVKFCLQMGQWTFATRTIRLDYTPSVEPEFGPRYAFEQPADMVRVVGIYADEHCTQPLLSYRDERHYWYADQQTIYASFVSNDIDYGADLSLWPETFGKLVEAYLAKEIAGNLTQGENRIIMADRAWDKAKLEARSLDAANKPTAFPPPGTWNLSRNARTNRSRWDGRY